MIKPREASVYGAMEASVREKSAEEARQPPDIVHSRCWKQSGRRHDGDEGDSHPRMDKLS